MSKRKCGWEGCDFKCSRSDSLNSHKRTHTGEKPYSCDFDECDSKFSKKCTLNSHKRTHTGEKPYSCDFDECDSKFSKKCHLNSHKRTHTGEKPYSCDFDECDSKFSEKGTLNSHKRTHTGEKPYSCDFDECYFKCSKKCHLKLHKRTHTGEKPYSCDFEGCDFKCSRNDGLKSHKRTHTPEGQIRRKKQEDRVHKLLKKWGYIVDVETTIKAKSSNCLVDTNRYFSRIDFHVVNCTNMILLLECDEDQHNWYNLSCEFSRMSDVRASLVKAGYTVPIYWIRYNPNGKFHIGDEQVKTFRPQREIELKNHLEKICSPEFIPEKQVNIHYMYYDLISEETGPEIMMDVDFPGILKEFVSWTMF